MNWNASALTHLAARQGYAARWLLWVTPKDLLTGALVDFGIWSGDDHQTITVDGVPRLYYGAQGAFGVDPVKYGTGLSIRTQGVSLSGVSPEGEQLVRGYNLRLAAAELHLALLDPQSFAIIDIQRMFKGVVNRAPFSTPAIGGVSTISLELVSSLRGMTKMLGLRKSDESQKLRSADRFRRFGGLANAVSDPWGGK